jgi:hypothetical protein
MATRSRKAVNDQAAQQLQASIRRLGNFEHISAHVQRGHLVVVSGDDAWPVARLTPLGGDHYGLSFHRHDGRWEPMPFSGPLDDVAAYPPDRHHLAGMTRWMRQRPGDARGAT